jgi:hypothetical protein
MFGVLRGRRYHQLLAIVDTAAFEHFNGDDPDPDRGGIIHDAQALTR